MFPAFGSPAFRFGPGVRPGRPCLADLGRERGLPHIFAETGPLLIATRGFSLADCVGLWIERDILGGCKERS